MSVPQQNPPEPDPFEELGRHRRPWWLLFVVALAALAVGGYVYARRHPRAQPPRFLTARVSVGDVIESIEATGTVQPLVQVQVGSQASGRILRLHADFNSRVRQGDLLAELDPTPFRAQVAQAQAALQSALAQVRRAQVELEVQERNFRRAQELRARNLNAQADVDAAQGARDSARAQLVVAQAEVSRARAALTSAQTQLTYTRIVAPIDGIVISRAIDTGQTVAASFQAPTLFVIANDLRQMRVIADIDEADIGKLREGMETEARVDAFPGEVFRGVVRELRYGPTTNQGVVTYPAVIDVRNDESKLRPGMTATITVVTSRRENVLRVPNAALRYRPSSAGGRSGQPEERPGTRSGRPYESAGGSDRSHRARVFVLRNGQPIPVWVRTGATDGTYTEVESPELRPGIEVITDETDEATAPASGTRPGGGGAGSHRGMRRVF